MTRVDWLDLNSQLFEDMTTALLSNLNPEIRRIDGSGGDGGRDAIFDDRTKHEIYQMKYFPRRLDSKQKRQVKDSLAKASEDSPTIWFLVIPLDPSPSEESWLSTLQESFPFPLKWRGKTWLDGQIAERPYIKRYFIDRESDHLLEMYEELRGEAEIADLPTGMHRLSSLAERINGLSPYWQFVLHVEDGVVSVEPKPRYLGAEEDHPFIISFGFAFPADDPAAGETFKALERTLDFGETTEVPGEYIRSFVMDGAEMARPETGSAGVLRIGARSPDSFRLEGTVCAVGPDADQSLAEVPVTFRERTAGRAGGVLRGTDRSGALSIRVSAINKDLSGQVNLSFSSTAEHYPQDLLPAVSLLRELHAPNRLKVVLTEKRLPIGKAMTPPELVSFIDDRYFKLIKDLARLQIATSTYFPIAAVYDHMDLAELKEALALLGGEEVAKPFPGAKFSLAGIVSQPALDDLLGGGHQMMLQGPGVATISGREIPLGSMRTRIPDARVANVDEVRRAVAEGATELPVELEPGSSDAKMFVSLDVTPLRSNPGADLIE